MDKHYTQFRIKYQPERDMHASSASNAMPLYSPAALNENYNIIYNLEVKRRVKKGARPTGVTDFK